MAVLVRLVGPSARWLLALVVWLGISGIASATTGFVKVPGLAADIGVGADGTVWLTTPDGSIYKYDGVQFNHIPGWASRVAVDPSGNAWVVNQLGRIFRYTGSTWVNVPGVASDIGVGAEGSVWITDIDGAIYRFNGASFQQIPGWASRVGVDSSGNAWVVNQLGRIFRYTGSTWVNVPGVASDIGVGADGTVWITDPAGYIYRYSGATFVQVPGWASQISVDPGGQAWVVNGLGYIYRYIMGQSYYVDSVGGSDSNSGTFPSSAWRSLTRVQQFMSANGLNPGDSVLFHRGDSWTGGLTLPIKLNGSPTARITFGSYGSGALPVIDGGGASIACFYARGSGSGTVPLWSYLTINGFECRNETEYGVLFYQNAGGSAGMPGIIVENMNIHNTGPATDDGLYRNQLMFLDENIRADGVKFLSNTVDRCGGHNCIQIQNDTGSPVVGGNTCYGWTHNCVDLKAVVGAVVKNNVVHGPALAGAAFYIENTKIPAADVTWSDNVVYDAPNGFECEGGGGTWSQSVTCRAYNNTAYLGNQSAIVTGSGCTQPISWDVRNNILDTVYVTYMPYRCTNHTVVWDYNDNGASYGTCSSSYTGIHDMDGISPDYTDSSSDPPDLYLLPGSPLIGAGLSGLSWNNNIGAF